MKNNQIEFKLAVVESFLAGKGEAELLARKWSVSEEKTRTWVSHYRLHGTTGCVTSAARTVRTSSYKC